MVFQILQYTTTHGQTCWPLEWIIHKHILLDKQVEAALKNSEF